MGGRPARTRTCGNRRHSECASDSGERVAERWKRLGDISLRCAVSAWTSHTGHGPTGIDPPWWTVCGLPARLGPGASNLPGRTYQPKLDCQLRSGTETRIYFSTTNCRPCALEPRCTRVPGRLLTPRRREEHIALEVAWAREIGKKFAAEHHGRAGIDGTLSQGVRSHAPAPVPLYRACQNAPAACAHGSRHQSRSPRRLARRHAARTNPPIRLRSAHGHASAS